MSKNLARSVLTALLVFTISFGAQAQADLATPLPVSPRVVVGKLPNGLTYYLHKNSKPEKKLELRLVLKAGSILEDDDQQGFAHFVEHMAFNGTANFRKSELVSYLQSIGVQFGADLNAYTSFDETVYILPIPTARREHVDKGFLVLRDWAQGLTLNGKDIDLERPVVMEELRLGKGAGDRMEKVLLPKLFNGSRYAQRLPIGQEAVIERGSHDALRRYYRDWYRPDLMAVVVVGDLDTKEAERLVRQHFSSLKNPARPRERFTAAIAPHSTTEAMVITDKEANGNALLIRYPAKPMVENNTLGGYRADLVQSLFSTMLNQRLQELAQQANAPFLGASSSVARLAARYETYNVSATLGKGGAAPAIDALVQENARASKFGFSAAELERARKNLQRRFERLYNEREKTDSANYAAEYIRNFLDNESIPGVENEYNYVKAMLPGVTLDEVNAYARATIPLDAPKLVAYMGAVNSETPAPSSEQLLAAVATAEQAAVTARDEKAIAGNLMETPPAPGKIVAESEDKRLGLTTLTLSNGLKVILKPTDFRNDQVLMSAVRYGGQSLFDEKDRFNARYANSVIGSMGLGNWSPLDLRKLLAGKTANVSTGMGTYNETVGGSSGSNDVETLLQLVYLKMTAVRRDPDLFQSYVSKQVESVRNVMSQPDAVFEDTQVETLFNNHPRVVRVPRPADYAAIDLDRSIAIYQQRFGSAKGFTFMFVGSFDLAAIKPLIASYLGALPTADVPTSFRDLNIHPVRGVVKKEVLRGTEAKSTLAITFTGATTYSEAEQLRLAALLAILNIKVTETLREKLALIYGGGFNGGINRVPNPQFMVNLTLPTGPANVDKAVAAAFAEIDKIKRNGPDKADLNKIKQNWLIDHRKSLRENAYWLARLQGAVLQQSDPATLLGYEKMVGAISANDLKLAAQRYFDMSNYVQVVLHPENGVGAGTAAAAKP